MTAIHTEFSSTYQITILEGSRPSLYFIHFLSQLITYKLHFRNRFCLIFLALYDGVTKSTQLNEASLNQVATFHSALSISGGLIGPRGKSKFPVLFKVCPSHLGRKNFLHFIKNKRGRGRST